MMGAADMRPIIAVRPRVRDGRALIFEGVFRRVGERKGDRLLKFCPVVSEIMALKPEDADDSESGE